MEERVWVESYEKELDPKKRREILDAAIEAEGRTPENELREKLLEARYTEFRGQPLDHFIRGWMDLQLLRSASGIFFGKRRMEKERARVREDFKMALAAPYGEAGRQVLFEEFRNSARLFIKLCKEDRGYSSLLFGLGHMKESSLTSKIANSLYTAGVQVPEKIGMAEELKDFRRAVVDAFREVYPDSAHLLTDRIA